MVPKADWFTLNFVALDIFSSTNSGCALNAIVTVNNIPVVNLKYNVNEYSNLNM